jgi:hypothetical protein
MTAHAFNEVAATIRNRIEGVPAIGTDADRVKVFELANVCLQSAVISEQLVRAKNEKPRHFEPELLFEASSPSTSLPSPYAIGGYANRTERT